MQHGPRPSLLPTAPPALGATPALPPPSPARPPRLPHHRLRTGQGGAGTEGALPGRHRAEHRRGGQPQAAVTSRQARRERGLGFASPLTVNQGASRCKFLNSR